MQPKHPKYRPASLQHGSVLWQIERPTECSIMKRRKMSGSHDDRRRSKSQNVQTSEESEVSGSAKFKSILKIMAAALKEGEISKNEWMAHINRLAGPWLRKALPSKAAVDPLSCQKCEGIPHEPITTTCGHTFCKSCLNAREIKCPTCGKRNFFDQGSPKTSVMISALVEKWWKTELTARSLRNVGNQLFKQHNYEEAEKKYTEAHQMIPTDFSTLSNRSSLYVKIGRLSEALSDAEQVIKLRPDWPKGYYRRGVALAGLDRLEEALVAFLQCTSLQQTVQPDVRDDIINVLRRMLKPCDDSCGERESFSDSGIETPGCEHHCTGDSEMEKIAEKLQLELENFEGPEYEPKPRPLEDSVEKTDFECALCFRLLWQPVTTPCGHTFCRCCLDRSLDHNPSCPLCKSSLEDFLAERKEESSMFLEVAMSKYLAAEYDERRQIHEEEMNELKICDQVPIFVCTMALPSIPCPLHVFEPRYRLMMRRAMESGSKEFGMCAYVEDQPGGYSQYGTIVKIRDIQYLPDGRSFVDTIGDRRFRVLRRGVKDGYNVARVEYVVDQPIDADKTSSVTELHDRLRRDAELWLRNMPTSLRNRIKSYCGPLPPVEDDWLSASAGPAWHWWLMSVLPIDQSDQLPILAITSLELRLETLQQLLSQIRRSGIY